MKVYVLHEALKNRYGLLGDNGENAGNLARDAMIRLVDDLMDIGYDEANDLVEAAYQNSGVTVCAWTNSVGTGLCTAISNY